MKPYDYTPPSDALRQKWASIVPIMEPDQCEWEYKNMHCCTLRHNRLGHWRGYVLIPQIMHEQIDIDYIEMHGGHSFNRNHNGDLWIGFDCGHSWDIVPGIGSRYDHDARYRGFAYVTKQVHSIVDQITTTCMLNTAMGGL